MNAASYARRRKACDFCVFRKIKCDSVKPTCSNCKLYSVDCRITDVTNTSRSKIPAPQLSPSNSSSTESRDDSIESRLAKIESRLDRIAADKATNSPNHDTPELNFQNFPEIVVYNALDMWNEATTLPCLGISPQFPTGAMMANTGKLELPPLDEILLVLERYFNQYNCYMPLFDKATFMRMTIEWYSAHPRQSLVPWAAINIVLAITYRVIDDLSINNPNLARCIRNVQSVTTELMAWSGDLLGLQVLLGMVILFQGTTNPQLAIVLIGSAIRLAQSMGLPSAKMADDTATSAQRRRVFWIAYILDKDLSLRAKAPYTQFDAETDVGLPEQDEEDNLGVLKSHTGDIRFNYLRARAELAVIQGRVHNILYSRTAQRLTLEQRSEMLLRIEYLLSNWRNAIPQELKSSDSLLQRFSYLPIHLVMNMYNRHLECLYRIYGIFAFDEAWINRVRCYLSPSVIQSGDDGIDGEINHGEISQLPSKWNDCVHHSRLGLELSVFSRETEYSVWLHACCNLSGLVILLVNIIEFPDHQLVVSDWKLIARIRGMFEQMNAKVSPEPFFLLQVAQELDCRARGQVKRLAHMHSFQFQEAMISDTPAALWADSDLTYM
ncbi:fungal-specific transcription factor domain-containing protein [Trichoderma evansii]